MIFRLLYLCPREFHSTESRVKVLFAYNKHALFHGLVPEISIRIECQLESRLMRHKHHDKVHSLTRGNHIARIILMRQLFHMLAYTAQMFSKCRFLLVFTLRILISDKGSKRYFRVDNKVTLTVHMDNHVWAHHAARLIVTEYIACCISKRRLYFIVQAFYQALRIQYRLQHRFAPMTLNRRVGRKSRRKTIGRIRHLSRRCHQVLDLFFKRSRITHLLLFILFHSTLHIFYRLLKRVNYMTYALPILPF